MTGIEHELATGVAAARRVADAAAQAHTVGREDGLLRTRYTDADGVVVHPPRAPVVVEGQLPAQIGRYTAAGLPSDPEQYPGVTGVVYVAADEQVELKRRHDGPGWTIRVVPFEPRDGPFAWACSMNGRRRAEISDGHRAVEALATYLRDGDPTALAYHDEGRRDSADQPADVDAEQMSLADL